MARLSGDAVGTPILDVCGDRYRTKSPEWCLRAIYADETPVGFLMLYDDPQKPEYHLWRFMIAEIHQGKGYARRAMELLIEHVGRRPIAEELVVSYVPREGSPEGFYRGLDFERTDEELEGEVVVCLRLSDHPGRTTE